MMEHQLDLHNYQQIGNALRAARKERNLTQADLAQLLDLNKSTICSMEQGFWHGPQLSRLCAAFDALGYSFVVRISPKQSIPRDSDA